MLTTVVENNDMERTCLVRWTDRVAQVVDEHSVLRTSVFLILQWPQMSQSETCGGAEQILGVNILQSRKYHNSNKLHSTKESPQPIEEKVGAFTKIIEAMGFTGPLKYSKWVKSCSSDFSFGGF
uniref:Uncharacterized protein n=1 Tax=Castor canadensis TaxID=51338 RepID=A0A8C0W8H8_CASCN